VLELKEITKTFPGVKALDNVSINFREGHIHALLGENGAGKSTLINIICGIYKPDQGDIILDGKLIHINNFREGLDMGISLVSQEIQVIPESSIAENIMLDKLPRKKKTPFLDWNLLNSTALRFMEMVGIDLDPKHRIVDLSAAQKQLVQIAKALSSNASILLLDEPTSSLTNHEVKNLFNLLDELRKKDVTIILVSHKLEEIFQICDQVTVIRDGQHIGTKPIGDLSTDRCIEMMIGRESRDDYLGILNISDEVVLETKNLFKPGYVHDVSLKLRKGEILGLYGLVGSGRTEFAKTLIGEYSKLSGDVLVNGKVTNLKNVSDSLYKHNIGYISENRKEEGLILDFDIETNLGMTIWNRYLRKISRFIKQNEVRVRVQKIVNNLEIKITSLNQKVLNLSGGNQQKVSISKWLIADCDILIIDEPTVGVDIGAKEYIHKIIWDLAAKQNKAIILISSDMPEMIKLARRMLIFKDNEIISEMDDLNNEQRSYEDISKEIGTYITST
jgi:ribose transport system ATP-binding protein